MEKPQLLLIVSFALTPLLQEFPHIIEFANDYLLPKTIDSAVYNDLHRVVQNFGASRMLTCGAMDGADARGRLDTMQRLHDDRGLGCTKVTMFKAAANGHLEVVKWLMINDPEIFQSQLAMVQIVVVVRVTGQDDVAGYLMERCDSLFLKARVEVAATANLVAALLPGDSSASESLHAAVAHGHAAMVEILLQDSPASTDATLALETAVNQHRLHIIRMIMHRGNPFDTARVFRAAVATRQVEVVDLLMPESDSVSVNAALIEALNRGCASIVTFLLERGQSDESEFILMKEAFKGRRQSVQQLLASWVI